jgi:hypothetical protein
MTSSGWQNVAPPIPATAPKTSRSGNGVVDVVSVSVFTSGVVEVVTAEIFNSVVIVDWGVNEKKAGPWSHSYNSFLLPCGKLPRCQDIGYIS